MPGTTRELTNTSDFPRDATPTGTEVVPAIRPNGQHVAIPVSALVQDGGITQAFIDETDSNFANMRSRVREAGYIEPDMAGSASAWTGTIPGAFNDFALLVGMKFLMKAPATNTGAVSIDLDGTAYPLRHYDGEDVSEQGTVHTNRWYPVRFGGSPGNYGFYITLPYKINEIEDGVATANSLLANRFETSVIEPNAVAASGDDWTGTVPGTLESFSLKSGQKFLLRAPAVNTGPVTLDLTGDAYPVVRWDGSAVQAGDLVTAGWYNLRFGGSAPNLAYYITDMVNRREVEENQTAIDVLEAQMEEAGVIEPNMSGSGGTWSAALPGEFSGLDIEIGQKFLIKAPETNTGAVTVDFGDGRGAIPLVNNDGDALEAGEVENGTWYPARYSGSLANPRVYLTTAIDLTDIPFLKWQTRLSRWVYGWPNRKNNVTGNPNPFDIVFTQEGYGSGAVFTISWRTARLYAGATNYQRIADLPVTEIAQNEGIWIDTTQTYTTEFAVSVGDITDKEEQFVRGDYVLLIGNYYGIPIGEMAGQIMLADLSDAVNQSARVTKLFDTGEEDTPDFVELDDNGLAIREVDQYGNTKIKNRALGGNGFTQDGDDEAEGIEVDKNGIGIMEVDENGAAHSPAARLFPIPYVDGTDLRAGEDGALVGPLRGATVLSAVPFNSKTVRALTTRAGLHERTSLSGTVGGGVLIPDNAKTIHIMLINGQSLSVGAQGDEVFSTWTERPDDALMFDGDETIDIRMGLPTLGGEFTVLDTDTLTGFQPLIAKEGQGNGSRGETVGEAIAEHISALTRKNGVQYRTLWIAPGLGGTAYSGLAQGTGPYNNMLAAVTRAKELAEALGWSVVVDGQIILHGGADSSNTGYEADLIEWQNDAETDLKAITGQVQDIPFFMTQNSSFYGSTTGTEAAKAFVSASENSAKHYLLGAHYPALDLYASDILHFQGVGYRVLGETFAPAITNILFGAADWECLKITDASRSGTTVTLTYHVPEGPLTIDTSLISERDTAGFRYFDGSGEVVVSSASVTDAGNDGTGIIELTLGNTPSGTGERVDYALDGHSGTRTLAGVPRGNVRDSAGGSRKSKYDGRRLDNWAIHQTMEVTVS